MYEESGPNTMSTNTVETTTTPAEVGSTDTIPHSLASPTRLKKVSERKKKGIEGLVKHQYPLLAKQYKALNRILPIDMESQTLTNLEVLAKTRRSVVTTIVLQEAVDLLGVSKEGKGRRAIFIIYYSQEFGTDKKGYDLPSAYWANGTIDKQVTLKSKFDEYGDELEPELGREFEVLTCPFTVEKLDQILTDQNIDNIEFSVTSSTGASYGGFSYEEVSTLPFVELLERGKVGRSGSDTTVMFSSLSLKEKLGLQK